MDENKLTLEILEDIKDGDFSNVDKEVLLELYKVIRLKQNKTKFVDRCIENEKAFLGLLENTEVFSAYGKVLSENLKDVENMALSSEFTFLSKIANTPKPNTNIISFVKSVSSKRPDFENKPKIFEDDDFAGENIGEIQMYITNDILSNVYIKPDIFNFIIKDLYENRAMDLDTEYEVKSFKDILTISAGFEIINDKMYNNYNRGQIKYLILSDNLKGLNSEVFYGLEYFYAPKGILPDNSILCIAASDLEIAFSLDILALKALVNNLAGKEYSKVINSIFVYKLHNPNYIGLLTIKD